MRIHDRVGQTVTLLSSVTCLFKQLNAFDASTEIIASVSSSAKTYSIAWAAALQPAS